MTSGPLVQSTAPITGVCTLCRAAIHPQMIIRGLPAEKVATPVLRLMAGAVEHVAKTHPAEMSQLFAYVESLQLFWISVLIESTAPEWNTGNEQVREALLEFLGDEEEEEEGEAEKGATEPPP